MTTPNTIHHAIASLRMRVQLAQEELKIAKARAEQDVIERLNGSYGKNEEERKRQLIIGLSTHQPYQLALSVARSFDEQLAQAEADLAVYLDARRQDEWSVRAKLVNALERRAIFTDDSESAAEAVLEAAADDLADAAAEAAMGSYNGRTPQREPRLGQWAPWEPANGDEYPF